MTKPHKAFPSSEAYTFGPRGRCFAMVAEG